MAQDKNKKTVAIKSSSKKLTHAARQKILKEGKGKINIPGREMEVIFIPNRVAEASYEYTLFEERTLNHILYALQGAVRASMNGLEHRQLDIFKKDNYSLFIDVPMNKITAPNQYAQLRTAIVEMGKTEVHIYSHLEKQHRTVYLFRGTNTWKTGERSNTMTVEVSHEVADLLIEVEKNRLGKPMQYTSFLLEAANSFNSKYGSRIYKIIAGWREKGSFYITLEDLRKRLGLGKRYPRYTDMKKNVLLPVQKEMEKNKDQFDCWFDCEEEGFTIKKDRNVVALFFKVYTIAGEQMQERKMTYLKTLLSEHFGLTSSHLEQLEEVFKSRFMNLERMMEEVSRLGAYCNENGNKIRDKAAYVTEAFLRMFAENRRLSTSDEN